MPMKALYTTIGGEIIAEKRDGVRRLLTPDPLGSTVALLDSNQTKTDSFAYWPYGEQRSRTGTTPTRFAWQGAFQGATDHQHRRYAKAYDAIVAQARAATPNGLPAHGLGRTLYGYGRKSPVSSSSIAGWAGAQAKKPPKDRRRGKNPRYYPCFEVMQCLLQIRANPCRCRNPKVPPPSLMLCVFWQESSLGRDPASRVAGNLGTMTDIGLVELERVGCNPTGIRIDTPLNGRPDIADLTWCEMVHMSSHHLGCIGLDRYGPPYPAALKRRIRQCEQDLGCAWDILGAAVAGTAFNAVCEELVRVVHK